MTNYRITLRPDDLTECPLLWDDNNAFIVLDGTRNSGRGSLLDIPLDYETEYALHHITEYVFDEDDQITALLKHFERRGIPAKRFDYHAYASYNQLSGVLVGEYADEDALTAWLDGDVYMMALEREETITGITGNELHVWDELAALGGIFVSHNGGEDIEELAREYAQDMLADVNYKRPNPVVLPEDIPIERVHGW